MAMYASYSKLGKVDDEIKGNPPKCFGIENFTQKQNIINSNKILVNKIFADWCGPCKAVTPKFAVLQQKYERPGCFFAQQDISTLIKGKDPECQAIPAFHFYKDGRLAGVVTGGDMNEVEKTLLELLGGTMPINRPKK